MKELVVDHGSCDILQLGLPNKQGQMEAAVMNPMKKLFNNTRKPEGFLGKMMAQGMNTGSHEVLAQWGFEHITILGNEKAIDLGCGGGGNVKRLLEKLPQGSAAGLDYSEVSVETSKKTNKEAIREGRCRIIQGNVMQMPVPDESVNIATAFETVYFWPDLAKSFAEIYRILKKGGFFMITNESDGKNEKSLKWAKIIDGMKVYTGDELKEYLGGAGFTDILVDDDEAEDRLCVVAYKR